MAGLRSRQDLQHGQLGHDSYPIDLDYLNRQSFGDLELRTEILSVYVNRLELHLSRIQQAQISDDVEVGLHTIKAASLGVGAGGIADSAQVMLAHFIDCEEVEQEDLADLAMMIVEIKCFIAILNEPTQAQP